MVHGGLLELVVKKKNLPDGNLVLVHYMLPSQVKVSVQYDQFHFI